jgi:iron-sulfur cluster repair protein YtfE (RIC family)
MTSATPHDPIDTSAMAVIHSMYRREFRLAGPLIRDVAPGDTERAAVVADHLEMIGRNLHHHHSTEDRLLWPLLLQRLPEEHADLVRTMEAQHHVVDRLQEQIAEVLPRWRASAGADDRDRLAGLFEELHPALVEHLDAEEQQMLPIAARYLSDEDWHALGEAGRRGTPRNEQMLTLGMFGHDTPSEEFAHFFGAAPRPVKWLLPKLGRRAYRKHATRVYGTPTPV